MKAFTPQIVTANDLFEGDAIYLTADHDWSREHREAALAVTSEEAEALLDAGKQPHVVGAYLADAKPGPNGPEPIHFREVFRTKGPSNRFHGKQEAPAGRSPEKGI